MIRINIGIVLIIIAIIGLAVFSAFGWNTSVFYILFGFAFFQLKEYWVLGDDAE